MEFAERWIYKMKEQYLELNPINLGGREKSENYLNPMVCRTEIIVFL